MSRRSAPLLLPLLLSSLLLVPAACGPPEDPVRALLDDAVEAAQDRDANAVGELLADDVVAGGMDRAALVGTLRQYLAAYQALDIAVSNVESIQRAGSARVTFRARLTGVPQTIGGIGDLVPSSAVYDFDLVLREGPDGWRISQISWQER